MVGMEDENPVHRAFDDGVHNIFLGRNAKGHAQEVAGIGQAIVRIDKWLTNRIFISHCGDGWHFGN